MSNNLFKRVQVGKITECQAAFGKHVNGRFIAMCAVRTEEDAYKEALEIFQLSGETTPITIYKASMVVYDKRTLEFLNIYLYDPEEDRFVRFLPSMWENPSLLDYGAFVGNKLYLFDVMVQINKKGTVASKEEFGGLEDEENKFILTHCNCFMDE